MARAAALALVHLALVALLYLAVVGLHRQDLPASADVQGLGTWTFSLLGVADGDAPVPVDLPHAWPRAPTTHRLAQYRATLNLGAPPAEPWVLYLKGSSGRIEAYLNSSTLPGHAADEGSRRRFHPTLFEIPASQWRAGENRVLLQITEDPPGSGYLDRVYLGPQRLLDARFHARAWLKQGFPTMLAVSGLVVGLIVLLLYLGRPRSVFFLGYALACAFGSAYLMFFLVDTPPLPARWWDALTVLNMGWFGITVAVVGYDYVGNATPGFVRLQILAGTILMLVLLGSAAWVSDATLYGYVLPAALWVDMLGGLVALFGFLRTTRATPVPFWMMHVGLFLLVVGAHDNLLLIGFRHAWLTPQDGLYFAFPAVLTLTACTGLLIRRYLLALEESESLNRDLAARVAAREAEIERSYAALRDADAQRAIAQERERLFADMHDGLGGTLVAALARADNEGVGHSRAASAIRNALDDLRLILASMHPADHSLAFAVTALRERLLAACEDRGVALQFNLLHLPEDLALPPAQTLSLLRILQELCTNALRHGQARNLSVSVRVASGPPAVLTLQVEDDGVGFDPDAAVPPGHYGVSSLRRRASDLGARLQWTTGSPGTRAALRLPLDI